MSDHRWSASIRESEQDLFVFDVVCAVCSRLFVFVCEAFVVAMMLC